MREEEERKTISQHLWNCGIESRARVCCGRNGREHWLKYDMIVVIVVAIWDIVVKMIIEFVGDVDGGCNVDRGGGQKDGAAGDVKDDKGWSHVIKVIKVIKDDQSDDHLGARGVQTSASLSSNCRKHWL